jgi:hypothetical protein
MVRLFTRKTDLVFLIFFFSLHYFLVFSADERKNSIAGIWFSLLFLFNHWSCVFIVVFSFISVVYRPRLSREWTGSILPYSYFYFYFSYVVGFHTLALLVVVFYLYFPSYSHELLSLRPDWLALSFYFAVFSALFYFYWWFTYPGAFLPYLASARCSLMLRG